MIEDTLAKMEKAIRQAGSADPKHRKELIRLLEALKAELGALSSAHGEKAHSIAGFAEVAAYEAARHGRSVELIEIASEGLSASVADFETTHPQLTVVVNEICTLLAGLGI